MTAYINLSSLNQCVTKQIQIFLIGHDFNGICNNLKNLEKKTFIFYNGIKKTRVICDEYKIAM